MNHKVKITIIPILEIKSRLVVRIFESKCRDVAVILIMYTAPKIDNEIITSQINPAIIIIPKEDFFVNTFLRLLSIDNSFNNPYF
jgi:hypothetical protein